MMTEEEKRNPRAKQSEEHLGFYIVRLVKEGERKKWYVTNLKANNAKKLTASQ